MGYSAPALGLAGAVLLLSILQQVTGHQNFDNLWLFTVAERVLDGATAYVDVIEANPPASFLIYLPSAALARLLGTSTEFMVCVTTFVAGLGLILFTGRILRGAGLVQPAANGLWLNMAIFIMLFVPGIQFAQREHIATLCLLPLLAVYSARAQGAPCSVGDAIAAGLLAGLMVAIKPHFSLAALFPLAFVVARRRSFRPIFQVESLAIVCVVMAYGTLLIWRYPAFFTMLPMLRDIYVPLRKPWGELFIHPMLVSSFANVCGVCLVIRKHRLSPVVATLLLATMGFIATYLIQAKGFPNHMTPSVLLALLAAGMLSVSALAAFASDGEDAPAWRGLRWPIFFGFLPLIGLSMHFLGVFAQFRDWEEHPGLRAAVQRWTKPQPRMISASILFHVGYPVVRQVGGVYVGRSNGIWVAGSALAMLDPFVGDEAYRARLQSYIDRDARMLLEDVRAHHPDIILTDHYSGTARALRHPYIAAAMADYARLEEVGDVVLWGRKP